MIKFSGYVIIHYLSEFLMKIEAIKQALIDLFAIKHPQVDVVFSSMDNIITLKSLFDDGNKFISFAIRDNSITDVKVSHKHVDNAKKMFNIKSIKSVKFDFFETFLNDLPTNSNFNQLFHFTNHLQTKNMFHFYRSGLSSTLPRMTEHQGVYNLISKFDKYPFNFHLENYFKLSRNGEILPVPMIRFFEYQNNMQMFAFNVIDQKVYKVKKELFCFEDFFENAELFDVDYHVDILVDEYLDAHILNNIDKNDSVRQSLISLPREDLKAKIDLISMYLI